MKEVHYFIPENEEELERLVGKTVGIDSSSSLGIMQECYFGKEDETHEFLRQQMIHDERKRSATHIIYSIRVNNEQFYFSDNGIKMVYSNFNTFRPGDDGYRERLQVLQQNKLWQEPKSERPLYVIDTAERIQ